MITILAYLIGLFGMVLLVWSFKRILKLVIGCVGITHCFGDKDKRTCTFIQTSRMYLRFYFLMLSTGVSLIVIACFWTV